MNELMRQSIERRVSEHAEKVFVLGNDTPEYVSSSAVRSSSMRNLLCAYKAIGSD